MADLKPCKCGGAVEVAYVCGEYFIVCENDCMDIPPCFHSNEQATIDEWNRRDGGKENAVD